MTRILIDREVEAPSVAVLQSNEAHYVTRVRRRVQGDLVEVRTPSGRSFEAAVSAIDSDRVTLEILRRIDVGIPILPVRLLISLPKRRLLDDVVRTASELGIERICPVVAERTVVQPGGEKLSRWRRVAEESLRQCGRAVPLIVEDVKPLVRAIEESQSSNTRLLLHPSEGAPTLTAAAPFRAPVTAAVGPEGGFTDAEVEAALSRGFVQVRLNTPILRIETAAVAAAVLLTAHIELEENEVSP